MKKKSNKITLKKLNKSTDYNALKKITSDPDVMRFIANRKIWTKKKLNNFFNYCKKDEKIDVSIRESFYYKIDLDNNLIGIIGVKLFMNETQLQYFLDKEYHGMGYGTQALLLFLIKIGNIWASNDCLKCIISQMLEYNIGSRKLCEKLGFKYIGSVNIYDKTIKKNLKYIKFKFCYDDDSIKHLKDYLKKEKYI